MTTKANPQKAAKVFAEIWKNKGYEKGESQPFWLGLLRDVFGIEKPELFIQFENRVKLDHTSFIDGYIPSTHVLIEQKSICKDLRSPIRQSDGTLLSPFQQAKRYSADLPYSERPRWIVTCNFQSFLIYDMEHPNSEPEEVLLENLEKEYYRLSFLVDDRNAHIQKEMEVSLKAGAIIGDLYDELLKQYIEPDAESLRSLNVLCVRLVFCLYAEDAGIFSSHSIFHDYLAQFKPGQGEMREALIKLFEVLDTPFEKRDKYLRPDLKAFPYCNGGLFSEKNIEIPFFNDKIAHLLLKNASSDFNWSEISPTIFGGVFESTLNPETRRKGGMHYTSIENIHKVIDPLFLNDLKEEFDKIRNIPVEKARMSELSAFQDKLASLTFLDPACGSGNFLTETYLSLRRLENQILIEKSKGQIIMGFDDSHTPVKVSIHQFYGIEINDFAVDVATTALWIAENQMLQETQKLINRDLDMLPLKTYHNIKKGNALRESWSTWTVPDNTPTIIAKKTNLYIPSEAELPKAEEPTVSYNEINVISPDVRINPTTEKSIEVKFDYIIGNPPFVGYTFQTKEQKKDLEDLNSNFGKNIDYVAGWYYKACQLIKGTLSKVAFVSTNSITQGEQVFAIWKPLLEKFGITINFAHQTFRWDSESSSKAHVHCVIIGFSQYDINGPKYLFSEKDISPIANNICPYLIDAPTVFIGNRKKPLCNVVEMVKGNIPVDGGNLIIEEDEYEDFIAKDPHSIQFIHPLLGAEEFINNKKRFCLWLVNASPSELKKCPLVLTRIERVREMRSNSSKAATRKYADYPYLFMEIRQPKSDYLLVPKTSSEKRRYIPIGYMDKDTITTDANFTISNATLFHFGVMTSDVHNAWMRAVCGRLKSDYRYSNTIVYNNFPWPNPTDEQKSNIEKTAQHILDARNIYPDSSLADLYDELTMPPELRKAHQENDKAVMAAYGFSTMMTESECVAELMKLYQSLTIDL